MLIELDAQLESALREVASRQGVVPEMLAIDALRRQFSVRSPLREPQDDWERQLRQIASDCGVSLSDHALSREELYD